VLLTAAELGLYRIHWSQEILDEVTRNLVKRGKVDSPSAEQLEAKMKEFFPEAMVQVPAELINGMTNHESDRHVLAAALVARASVIVTANLKHFPFESLTPLDIEAQHPDVFLVHLLDLCPEAMEEVLIRCTASRRQVISIEELLLRLRKTVPQFAEQLSVMLSEISMDI
jgi:hypothetical protein